MTSRVRTRRIIISRKLARCPLCGEISKRHSTGRRWLHDVGVSAPVILDVTYSKHFCARCQRHFSLPMDHLAPLRGRFTHRVRRVAVGLVVSGALTLESASFRMRQRYFVHVPPTTLHDWVLAELAA